MPAVLCLGMAALLLLSLSNVGASAPPDSADPATVAPLDVTRDVEVRSSRSAPVTPPEAPPSASIAPPAPSATVAEVRAAAATTTTAARRVRTAATVKTTTTTTAKPKPTTTTTKPRPTTTTTTEGRTQSGKASYYDHQAGVCAHRTLPMGTIVTVTNTGNGKSTTCRVADRGPYIDGRIIDLDRTVFEKIAPISAGVINVRITW